MDIIKEGAMTMAVSMRGLTVTVILILAMVLIGCSSTKSSPSLSLLREGDVVTKMAEDENYLYSTKEPRYVSPDSKKLFFGLKLQIKL
jgi:hypothetical protein